MEIPDGIDEGGIHGPAKPRVWKRKIKPLFPKELLPSAQSVLVIGIAIPEPCFFGPIGSYAYGHYEALEQLKHLSLQIVNLLHDWGFEARVSFNLYSLATEVVSPRGRLPDARSNVMTACLAGLGEIGLDGALINPDFGVRLRFVAIATNAKVEFDRPYQGPPLCRPDECGRACIKSCPVGALAGEREEVCGFEFRLPQVDIARCDWAKKFGLVGEEGPKFIGSKTEVKPPPEITPDALLYALRNLDPIQKHWLCIREPCLVSCQSFLRR